MNPKLTADHVRRPPAWFTLAELVVVIAILAILSTIGFLALQGHARNTAETSLTGSVVNGASGTLGIPSSSTSSSGGGTSRYPGCDTPDIVLANGQRWAACNVGATKAWSGILAITNCSGGATDCVSTLRFTLGSYFQWGRNDDVTATAPVDALAAAGTLAGNVGHSNFITKGSSPYDWIATQNGNLWGGGSTSLGSGLHSGQTAANRAAMKGPCATGYHVPTQAEWWSAISTLNSGLTNTAAWQNDMSIRTMLKLPLAGNRDYSSAAYDYQGTNGYYWASSPAGNRGYLVSLSATQVVPALNPYRADGFSVRCLKN